MALLPPANLLILEKFLACMIITSCTFIRYSRVLKNKHVYFSKCWKHFPCKTYIKIKSDQTAQLLNKSYLMLIYFEDGFRSVHTSNIESVD